MKSIQCTLCKSTNIINFSKDKKREYLKCNNCETIFVPNSFHLSITEEKNRYDLHTNSTNDPYYKKFLSRIIKPILKNINEVNEGLDFGCGPGPILKELFDPYDIYIEEYDLYYKDDKKQLNRNWDLIVTTEVVEHLKTPFDTIKQLWGLINPGGVLAIMTCRYDEQINFDSWYYKGDPTHICFFSERSFKWLAHKLSGSLEFFDKDITILKKN